MKTFLEMKLIQKIEHSLHLTAVYYFINFQIPLYVYANKNNGINTGKSNGKTHIIYYAESFLLQQRTEGTFYALFVF